MTTATISQLQLECEFVRGISGRTQTGIRDLVLRALRSFNATGKYRLKVVEQATMRHRRFHVVRGSDHRVLLRIRPGDNSTCWEGWLTPPNPGQIPVLISRLQDFEESLTPQSASETKPQEAVPATTTTAKPTHESEPTMPEFPRTVCQRFGWRLPVHIGMDIWATAILASPEASLDILADYNKRNRRQRSGQNRRLKNVIDTNLWELHHQGAAFDINGELADGQHRFEAIAESDSCQSVPMVIFFNLPPRSRKGMDQHTIRSIQDIAGYEGVEVKALETAALRRALRGFESSSTKANLSPTSLLALRDRHIESLRWLVGAFSGFRKLRGVMTAPVYGALLRAYYHEPSEKLTRFVRVLCNGISEGDNDKTVLSLRELLLGARGPAPRDLEAYRKVSRTIKAYCRGLEYVKVVAASEEIYSLPDNPEAHQRKRHMALREQGQSEVQYATV